jgi:Calcineurin-like phosphoesterase
MMLRQPRLWLLGTAVLLLLELRAPGAATVPVITEILGRPTHESVTVNARADSDLELYFEYGREQGQYGATTVPVTVAANQPVETLMDRLSPDARYFYRARYRTPGSGPYQTGAEHSFHSQRRPGSTFTFAAQGDSHPERAGIMFNSNLYVRTLQAVAAERPDFYLTSGDDFSVDTLRAVNAVTVAERYALQLPYLALVGQSSPLFLVNGNHEQAARYLLDGSANNVAVWAQNARNRFFPQPAPDGFYSGNTEVVPNIGLLRNYYAWEWGDALFVTIDPYWASPVAVDNVFGDDTARTRDPWQITHGDAQYEWLKKTLEGSRAKWKFVFAHHVNGTGRGAVEVAGDNEWGGKNRNGTWGFTANRPQWPLPIHQLMAANGVTIFFQGHDHLFARQELDGITYQELPNPADDTYTAFNDQAYRSGDKFPNSGYVRVTVSPESVHVEYIRMFLPNDEVPPGKVSGMVQFAYSIPPK